MSVRSNLLRVFPVMLMLLASLPGAAQTTDAKPVTEAGGAQSMNLDTGRIDTRPLDSFEMQGTPQPLTPPQTVEGTLKSLDSSGTFIVVDSEVQGEVKIGLPPNVQVLRDGEEAAFAALKPGDRIFATVVVSEGNRALRVVADPPTNPLINGIGIPLLLIIALAIWWTGRNRERVVAEPPKPARAK